MCEQNLKMVFPSDGKPRESARLGQLAQPRNLAAELGVQGLDRALGRRVERSLHRDAAVDDARGRRILFAVDEGEGRNPLVRQVGAFGLRQLEGVQLLRG